MNQIQVLILMLWLKEILHTRKLIIVSAQKVALVQRVLQQPLLITILVPQVVLPQMVVPLLQLTRFRILANYTRVIAPAKQLWEQKNTTS